MNESTAASTLPCVMSTVCFFPFLVLSLLENSSKICHESQADHIQPLPKISKEETGILTLRLFVPCWGQWMLFSIMWLIQQHPDSWVLPARKPAWPQLPPTQELTFFFLLSLAWCKSKMGPLFCPIYHKGHKTGFFVFPVFSDLISLTPCSWSSTANWQGFGGSVPTSTSVYSGISGEY